jgi:hypothetical protein
MACLPQADWLTLFSRGTNARWQSKWRGLQPAGVSHCKYKNPQTEACSTQSARDQDGQITRSRRGGPSECKARREIEQQDNESDNSRNFQLVGHEKLTSLIAITDRQKSFAKETNCTRCH